MSLYMNDPGFMFDPGKPNKDNKKLYELFDILSEIRSVKEDPKYATLLSYYDTSSGVNPVISR